MDRQSSNVQKMAFKWFTKKFFIIERHAGSRQLLHFLQRRQMSTEDLFRTGSKVASLATGKTCLSPQILQRFSSDGGENRTQKLRLELPKAKGRLLLS